MGLWPMTAAVSIPRRAGAGDTVRTRRTAAPQRPPALEESAAYRLFAALSPRLPRKEQTDPPRFLGPFEHWTLPRRYGRTGLSATFYPAAGTARGAVLLAHPWNGWGKAYFHRRGRIPPLRDAGYHVLAFDFPGFGDSGRPDGFFDRDVEDALVALAARVPGLDLHVWGVSAGGYWAHAAIARTDWVRTAIFEDVAPHFLDWSARVRPLGRPFYRLFRLLFSRAHRFLDVRRHAAALELERIAYVGGGRDHGIPTGDLLSLAGAAGTDRTLIVETAEHLEAIKRARREIVALALETFDATA